MSWTDERSVDPRKLFHMACRRRWRSAGGSAPQTWRAPAITELIPNRPPFLFVDRLTFLDLAAGHAEGVYDLAREAAVFTGHFPGDPVWPGVLHVDAIGQVGMALARLCVGGARVTALFLTRICEAAYLYPVRPGLPITIVARISDDGLYYSIVGQVSQGDRLCSAAHLQVLEGPIEEEQP